MDDNNGLSSEVSLKTSRLNKLTKEYNDLREDTGLLYKKLLKLKAEATRPQYASISSIERTENFKFPRNFVAPKSPLGSGKPTLLKVRAS